MMHGLTHWGKALAPVKLCRLKSVESGAAGDRRTKLLALRLSQEPQVSEKQSSTFHSPQVRNTSIAYNGTCMWDTTVGSTDCLQKKDCVVVGGSVCQTSDLLGAVSTGPMGSGF